MPKFLFAGPVASTSQVAAFATTAVAAASNHARVAPCPGTMRWQVQIGRQVKGSVAHTGNSLVQVSGLYGVTGS